MKHEVTSLNTKKLLAESLKGFMIKKPLSKITVSEIIADCGINRKTFYYHFEDIYALLKWILEAEAVSVVEQFDLLVDYEEVILFVMDYVENNKHILSCAYDSIGREQMKRFLYTDFVGIVGRIIGQVEDKLAVSVDESFKEFLCDFYTEALAGLLINLFKEKKTQSRKELIDNISLLLKASLPSTLRLKAMQQRGENIEGCIIPAD